MAMQVELENGDLFLSLIDNFSSLDRYRDILIYSPRTFAEKVDAVLVATVKDPAGIQQGLTGLPVFKFVPIYTLGDL